MDNSKKPREIDNITYLDADSHPEIFTKRPQTIGLAARGVLQPISAERDFALEGLEKAADRLHALRLYEYEDEAREAIRNHVLRKCANDPTDYEQFVQQLEQSTTKP